MIVKTLHKTSKYFECDYCHYLTSNKRDYNKHLLTVKHKIRSTNCYLLTNSCETDKHLSNEERPYKCLCGKDYKYKQNIYAHRKKCLFKEESINDHVNIPSNDTDHINEVIVCKETEINYKEMFLEMVNQNKILQNTICELIPKVGNNTNNTNITHNTTNNVNITLFLNDNCKDAMSINDFIKLVKVDMDDLLFTCKNGLTNGISNIFIENFNRLPLVKRPLWCSDKKRRKIFIKDDVWEEDTNNEKTKAAIKQITAIQAKNTTIYAKNNPDWMKDDKKKDTYISIIKETTNCVDDKMDKILDKVVDNSQLTIENRDKIIKKLNS